MQQAFGHFLCNASAWRLAALLQNLQPTPDRGPILPQPWVFRVSLTMPCAGSTAYKLTPSVSCVFAATEALASAIPN